MPVDTLTAQLTPDCISKPQAQHDIDEHALAAMSMYDSTQGSILSPTPRALNFPNHPMLDITLDGPTPRAFTFPTTVHETMSNGNHGPPLTPPEPSPSTPSTSPSPFEPEQRQDGFQPQDQGYGQPRQQPKAPSIARRSQSMQRARADTASPAAQISSFNAPDPNPGQPLTLAARRRGSSISSLVLPAHSSHTLNFTHSQPPAQTQQQPPPLPPNPHAHAIQLAGTERRPKRGDEDYIKRPENAFILFRRECCLKRNEAEAAAAQEGDPVQRRQRQADLSKTISQQWRSLSAEERKYWDDLAKQRKKEHEEMYPWYVYQPTRSDKKKKKKDGESTEGGKAKKEKEGKKERRERTKSSSRVRGTGARARNSSTCSSASVASTTSMSSSASTVDSEDFSEFDSADSALYSGYGYSNGTCSSVREVEAADAGDFEMSESECSQAQPLSLPFSLSMPSLTNGNGTGSGQGAGLTIDTRNALASFSLESGPITTSGYSHSHHGGHGRGHGHSLSAQVPMQTVQSVVPGPLSFVLPQNRRSTSAPGDPAPPNMPADLYQTPPTIKIPQLLDTNGGSNNSSNVSSPVAQEPNAGEQQPQMNGQAPHEQQRESEFNAMNTFQFPNVHPQPEQMGFGMPGQVPDFSSAGNEIQQNSMFHVYEEPLTAKPRPRALSQITIPNELPTNSGPLSAPAPNDTSASSSRMFIPDQFSAAAGQQPNGQLQVPQRAIPQGLPESPEPPAPSEWEDYGLPSWAMSTFTDADEAAFQQAQQQQQQGQETQAQPQNVFGEIDITMDMGLPPWIGFGSMDPMNSMGAMNSMGCGMDAMATDGGGAGENHNVDPYAMHFWQEELLDPSQL